MQNIAEKATQLLMILIYFFPIYFLVFFIKQKVCEEATVFYFSNKRPDFFKSYICRTIVLESKIKHIVDF